MNKGIIISIQGYHQKTITELSIEAASAGAVGLRVDKPLLAHYENVAVIGLNKSKVNNPEKEAYITATLEDVERVSKWADFVAVDYRRCNAHLDEIAAFCRKQHVKVVADIACFEDYENIKDKNYPYAYVATTLSVFHKRYEPDIRLVRLIKEVGEKNIIAEGNYSRREDVRKAYEAGATQVCLGAAVSNIYKLARKYTTITT